MTDGHYGCRESVVADWRGLEGVLLGEVSLGSEQLEVQPCRVGFTDELSFLEHLQRGGRNLGWDMAEGGARARARVHVSEWVLFKGRVVCVGEVGRVLGDRMRVDVGVRGRGMGDKGR